ncbi:transcription termination/antitermination protein NusG [Candidatus Gracilibacteria bacterium]|nr:transcription termination/antitermination protein NusG [Candidatus Gracilibacteria bacterium]
MKNNIKQDSGLGRQWFVIHTYSGYEDAVEKALRNRIETMNMQDLIFDVQVPKEPEFVIKKGKPHEIKKRIFPGYVLVNMIVTDESWFIVRNTPNVTGFIGAGNTPVPVSPEEFGIIQLRMKSKEGKFKTDFEVGELVKITSGPFSSYEGKVTEVDDLKGKIKVSIDVFDRETQIELDFNQIAKK